MLSQRLVLFLAILPTPAVAQTASQAFNLECVGQNFIGEMKEILRKEKYAAVNVTYKVDFRESRWCSGTCVETFPVVGRNDKFIVLAREGEENDPSWQKDIYLNRETGALVDRIKTFDFLILTTALCIRQPFSGFPTRKF